MDNLIVIAILAVVLGAAGRYLYKAKKSGRKCVGCSVGGCSCGCDSCKETGCCCTEKK